MNPDSDAGFSENADYDVDSSPVSNADPGDIDLLESVHNVIQILESDDDTRSVITSDGSTTDAVTEDTDDVEITRGSKRELEDDDCETNKKKRVNSEDEDEGQLCPICLDVWSNSGEHRVCCLKCGHLFGHSCLTRWLNSLPHRKKTCPTCKRRVNRCDIRFLYVKKLIAIDTSELENVRKQLEDSNRERNQLRLELSTLNVQMEHKIKELRRENEQLKMRRAFDSLPPQNKAVSNELKSFMDKSLEISTDGGCRVLDYSPWSKTVAVSMTSPNPLFTGCGVRKITLPDYKPTAFIPLHAKAIRDLAFKNNILLSVSFDMKAKLIDMNTNSPVSTFTCTNALWSCCWDIVDSNVFYVGESRGSVSVFDIRNPRNRVTNLDVTGDCSPVLSLASTPWQPGEAMPRGGLLCCKINSCWAFEKTNQSANNYECKPLALDGPFLSLRYNEATGLILISARANQRYPYTRHTVCELSQNGSLQCNIVHTFQGASTQSMLSRSCLFNLENNVYAAAYHESSRNVTMWSVKTGNKVGSVPAHMPILDLCPIQMLNVNYVTTLNEKKMDFFQITKV